MAQGKMKVKGKVPQKAGAQTKKKGAPVTKRANKPIQPKKRKFEEATKLKKMITKTVNKAAEEEIRDMSMGPKKTLSKAQEAVAAHHQKGAGSSKT